MPYKVYFLSLGCAKNQVNCEQMMSLVQSAGHEIVASPTTADVAVVNTCGFLASACEEAIDHVLELAKTPYRPTPNPWKPAAGPATWETSTPPPKTAPASSPHPPGSPTSASPRAATTTAPTALFPPCGGSTAAAP